MNIDIFILLQLGGSISGSLLSIGSKEKKNLKQFVKSVSHKVEKAKQSGSTLKLVRHIESQDYNMLEIPNFRIRRKWCWNHYQNVSQNTVLIKITMRIQESILRMKKKQMTKSQRQITPASHQVPLEKLLFY